MSAQSVTYDASRDLVTDLRRRYGIDPLARPLKRVEVPGLNVGAYRLPWGEPANYLVTASAPDGLIYGAIILEGAARVRREVDLYIRDLSGVVS